MIGIIDQMFPQPMEDDTLIWLGKILKPFFVQMLSDPPHLIYTKMLPNPSILTDSDQLRKMNTHTQNVIAQSYSNYFSREEQVQVQAKFLYRLKEFVDVLSIGVNEYQIPVSLINYLNKELLMRPN